jgi:uncharacterized protein (TIGR03437 family)
MGSAQPGGHEHLLAGGPDVAVCRQNAPAEVFNQDNTLNTPSNPAARRSTIRIYAIGQGFVPNAPPDSSPAPSPPLSTPFTPLVAVAGLFTYEWRRRAGAATEAARGVHEFRTGRFEVARILPAQFPSGGNMCCRVLTLLNAGSVIPQCQSPKVLGARLVDCAGVI